MSKSGTFEIYLADEAATSRLANLLASALDAGDTLLLRGPIGAGKTHFCRSLIQTRLGRAEDVPSPTFTLVQTYDADVEIWHADLYRLTHPDEAVELGLEQAFETAICLVEWPDRLGSALPPNAIDITFSAMGPGRIAKIDLGNRTVLRSEVLTAFANADRSELAMRFLDHAGWGHAIREPLGGDASARRYERLYLDGQTRLLMDAPPGQADRVEDFTRIADHLNTLGLSAPHSHTADPANGFALIEDFGDGVFARLIQSDPAREEPLYTAAVNALSHLQANQPATGIPCLTHAEWAVSVGLVLDWYRFAIMGDRSGGAELTAVLQDRLSTLADLPQVMILRDYHAENLMWLPGREGLRRVGLLDFQLAQMGQPGYDLVSLLQDARRDVAVSVEQRMITHFLNATGHSAGRFLPSYACLGALRALRILGIFARLCLTQGKAGYVRLMPRVWEQLHRNLAHPDLKDLQQICLRLLPQPDAAALYRIEGQCGNFR